MSTFNRKSLYENTGESDLAGEIRAKRFDNTLFYCQNALLKHGFGVQLKDKAKTQAKILKPIG
jgi:hypothetical protein